ncbi:hypothetical protein ACLMJK_003176 [Lecanora helva]
MGSSQELGKALHIVYYLSPILLISYYIIAVAVSVCTLQNLKSPRNSPRKILLALTCMVLLSYFAEDCMLVVDAFKNNGYHYSTASNTYVLSNTMIWTILALSVWSAGKSVWYPYYGSWFIALIAEGLLLALGLGYGYYTNGFAYARMTVEACRLLLLVALPTTLFTNPAKGADTEDEESSALLRHKKAATNDTHASNGAPQYGSITASSPEEEVEDEAQRRKDEEQQKLDRRLQESGNWFRYIARFSVLFKVMWPFKRRLLQLSMAGICLCLLCVRTLNVLEPRQLGIVLDRLDLAQIHIPVTEILLYFLFKFLSNSVILPIENLLWLPINLHMEASIKTAAYDHIINLSRDFHTEKQTGELFASIGLGNSMACLLSVFLFRAGPTCIDLVVAFCYLYNVFGPYMALDVAATTISYVWISTYLLYARQSGPLRRYNSLYRKESQLMYDTVGGWSSVAYFNRQDYEQKRFSQAVGLTQLWERKTDLLFFLANVLQDGICGFGLIVAGIIAVYQIADGSQKVGSFVMLMTYWGSFTSGLWGLARTQRDVRRYLIDAESLVDLFHREPSVKNGPKIFQFKRGAVQFQDVGFSYDSKTQTIQDFSFQAGPGQKIALVGETGGGKSTILKLLFRFYDVQQGKILIDGQDIKEVTLSSLRQRLGVVPQDPALFNDSVLENVRYSKLGASDEEVMEACKSAAIHDKILTFTEGYRTRVGENGVKLSGGELQRIAIARVILQNPEIILLDEATSAVDTETEAHIQKALHELAKGRTTITIAHRLSTVTNSDVIVVVKGGKIVEQGSPTALLEAKGKFSELWLKQIGIRSDAAGSNAIEDLEGQKLQSEGAKKESHTGLSEASSSSGKSLRPTAPEFVPQKGSVPQSQDGTAAKVLTSACDDKVSEQEDSHDAPSGRKSADSIKLQKRKNPANFTTDTISSDSQRDNPGLQLEGTGPAETGKKRQNLAQRQRNNKSEPSGSAVRPTQMLTPDGSTDQSGVATQSRRVSAPARPLSNVTNSQHTGRNQRRRAQRSQIRKRKTAPQHPASTSVSGSWSTETLHPDTPVVRLPGSADDTGSSSTADRPDAAAGSVHFAPGS